MLIDNISEEKMEEHYEFMRGHSTTTAGGIDFHTFVNCCYTQSIADQGIDAVIKTFLHDIEKMGFSKEFYDTMLSTSVSVDLDTAISIQQR